MGFFIGAAWEFYYQTWGGVDYSRQSGAAAVDPLGWARRLAPSPQLIFLGFMLPVLLSGLLLLCLRWQDMRWQAAAAAVFAGMVGLAVICARRLSQVQMTRRVVVSLTAAVTALAAVGTLAVAPGTTDAFAFWVSGNTGIVIAAIYFIRGPAPGLTALALDLAALTAGVLACGSAIPIGAQASILGAPVIGAGFAIGFRAAFRCTCVAPFLPHPPGTGVKIAASAAVNRS